MKKIYYKPAIKIIKLSSERLLATSSVSSQNESSLETEIAQLKGDLKKQKSEAQKLKKRLKQLEETVVVVQKEHQQFQANQMSYKRVPGQVMISKQNETKECPKCRAMNPIEANFCRFCAFSFKDKETEDATEDRESSGKSLSEES